MPRFSKSDIRDAFGKWWDLNDTAPTVNDGDYVFPIRWLVGQLWNNTDIAPGDVVAAVRGAYWPNGMPADDAAPGISYAQAARMTRAWLIENDLWEAYPATAPKEVEEEDTDPALLAAIDEIAGHVPAPAEYTNTPTLLGAYLRGVKDALAGFTCDPGPRAQGTEPKAYNDGYAVGLEHRYQLDPSQAYNASAWMAQANLPDNPPEERYPGETRELLNTLDGLRQLIAEVLGSNHPLIQKHANDLSTASIQELRHLSAIWEGALSKQPAND